MEKAGSAVLFLLGGVFLFSSTASASRPFLASESAVPIERGYSRLEIGYEFARFSEAERRQTFLAELTYGLLNNMDFEVEIPVLVATRSGDRESGLGDLRIKSRVRFLKAREANPLSLSGQISIKFPTCDEGQGTGPKREPIPHLSYACTGETDVGLLAMATKSFYPVVVHLNVGYILMGNPPGGSKEDVLSYDLAFEYETPLEGFSAVAEAMWEINRNIHYSGQDPFSVLFGGIYRATHNLHLDGAFSLGLTEGSAHPTLTVGMAYFF